MCVPADGSMARRARADAAGAACVALGRGVCAAFAVCAAALTRTVHQAAGVSDRLAAAVSKGRSVLPYAAVSAALRRHGRRRGAAFDPAARRQHHDGRDADGYGPAACGTAFGSGRRHPAADDTHTSARAQAPHIVYGRGDRPEGAYLPTARADRQRKPVDRAAQRFAGDPARSGGRYAVAADPLSKRVTHGRPFRRARAVRSFAGLSRSGRRLRLRSVALADEGRTGNLAGKRITAGMEDKA